MPGPAFVEGDRVTLRPVEEADHEFLYRRENTTGIRQWLGRATVLERETIEEMLGRDNATAFLPCVEGDPVGYVWVWGIDADDGAGGLGYWIRPDDQGKGYATEAVELVAEHAFRERRFHRLQARAWETNEGSRRVLEKVGFQEEGRLREAAYVDGEFLDAFVYGLLATEWQ